MSWLMKTATSTYPISVFIKPFQALGNSDLKYVGWLQKGSSTANPTHLHVMYGVLAQQLWRSGGPVQNLTLQLTYILGADVHRPSPIPEFHPRGHSRACNEAKNFTSNFTGRRGQPRNLGITCTMLELRTNPEADHDSGSLSNFLAV